MLQRCSRVQAFGAGEGAKSDLIALSQFHVTTQHLKSFVSVLVARVNDPAVCLHQDSWAEVVLWVPPVGWAGGRTASAQDAFVQTVQKLAVLSALQILCVRVSFLCFPLEEWFDGLVLGVEVRHVYDEIFEHKHEHEWRDHTLLVVFGNRAETSQVVPSIDIHRARAANTLSA